MAFAVFCFKRSALKPLGPPSLDPMDYGIGDEPSPHLLLRRSRVGLFATRDDAEAALRETGRECKGQDWTKEFGFLTLECVERSPVTPLPASVP
jgi:hypothetical protein